MYERSYGYRYGEVADRSTNADIAKLIRADVKQAVAEGLLPVRWKYSVTSNHLSINVRVRGCTDAWTPCEGIVPGTKRVSPDGSWHATSCSNVWCKAKNDPAYAHGAEEHDVLTEEAAVAKMTLQRIHSAYNHDGSEIMTDYFDVRYYGHVEFETADSAEWRAKYAAKQAAKKAARENGEVVGRVANYGRDGRAVVHVLVKTTDGKQAFGCGARVSATGFRGKVGDDTPVTCSRCAKRFP